MTTKRMLAAAILASVLFVPGLAHAGVHFSFGFGFPFFGIVAPPPVVVAPAPVYVPPPPAYYAYPAPAYPAYYGPYYGGAVVVGRGHSFHGRRTGWHRHGWR